MNLPNGHSLQNGKYRITHVIGQGGFGITYKGIWFTEVKGALGTVKTEVPICIKEYFFKDYCYRDTEALTVKVHSETGKVLFDKFKEKLIKEAKILSEVHHPHIVNVLEVFEENGTAYIAMEYISGCSLKYMMDKEGKMPEGIVLRYVRQIGEALQFVHDKNILHLDIKPSNILIDSAGKVRLIDFGVSKRYDIEQQETSTTMLTLSKGFASIEQYDNEGTQNFSPCPDIYSLGATMYNLLTGKIPTESILRATRPLSKPTDLNPEITPKTEAAIIKAMQIIPTDRFQTISEMMDSLELPVAGALNENKNNLSQEEMRNEDETTVVYSSSGDVTAADDEQTVVKDATIILQLPPVRSKKKKKGILVTAVIAVFACIGAIVTVWVQGRKAVSKEMDVVSPLPDVSKQDVVTEVLPQTSSMDKKEETSVDKEEPDNSTSQPQEKPKMQPDTKETKKNVSSVDTQEPAVKPVTTDMQKTNIQSVQPTSEELNNVYATFLSSAKTKMNKAEYAGAMDDLKEAAKIKATDEVLDLLGQCNLKEAEKQLATKKAQYEEMMTLGKYRVVKKKSTGKYGAIDANANERIPCKYVYVGSADNGRAFEREDGLYDIYNTDGILINKGVTYYN